MLIKPQDKKIAFFSTKSLFIISNNRAVYTLIPFITFVLISNVGETLDYVYSIMCRGCVDNAYNVVKDVYSIMLQKCYEH